MMKIQVLLVVITLLKAQAQQQSNETCDALDTLLRDHSSLLGECRKNSLCTGFTCINRPEESPDYINTTVTFAPCTDPISVTQISAFISPDQVYINVTLNQSSSVELSDPSFGTFNLGVAQIDNGINFGLTTTVRIEGSSATIPLLTAVDVPLSCSLPQQSTETCAALDMLIAGRNQQRLDRCTKNSLCTSITCVTTLSEEPVVNLTNILTFLPCTDPMSIVYYAFANGGVQDIIQETVTSNQSVVSNDPTFGTYNITLTQIDGGVNYGLSVTNEGNGTATEELLLSNTNIPLQCEINNPITAAITDAGTRAEPVMYGTILMAMMAIILSVVAMF